MALQSSVSLSCAWVSRVPSRRARNTTARPVRKMAKNRAYATISRVRRPRTATMRRRNWWGRRRRSRSPITSHLRLFGGPFGHFDHITDAPDRLDQLLLEAVVDFAPQVADIDVHDIGEAVVVHIPHMLHDHGAAQRTAAVAHQVFENAELFGRQVYGLGAAQNFAADAVEREIGDLQFLGRGLAAAQQGAYAGQQFHERERLYQ